MFHMCFICIELQGQDPPLQVTTGAWREQQTTTIEDLTEIPWDPDTRERATCGQSAGYNRRTGGTNQRPGRS